MTGHISENFSDIPKTNPVGRPRKWTYFDNPKLALFRPEGWTAMSRRSQINQELYMCVFSALDICTRIDEKDPKYNWLFRWIDGAKKQGMLTVIYALGRFEDPDDIVALADYICENQLKSKKSIELIRNYKKIMNEKSQEVHS